MYVGVCSENYLARPLNLLSSQKSTAKRSISAFPLCRVRISHGGSEEESYSKVSIISSKNVQLGQP